MDKVIRVRVTDQMKRDFDETVNKNSHNASQLLRNWIQDYIDENKEDNVMTKVYEESYIFNVNVSVEDGDKIEQEVNRIHNMLNDLHNQQEINGLDTLLYELELEVNENEDNVASIESVEYGKLNTDTGYNHFVVADVDIKIVEEYMVYSVSLSNVRTFKELA